jgi:eukaryotic-like serine/threonine-protein kinase
VEASGVEPERWARVEELYHASLQVASGERAAFLKEACRDDEELRREVESLLAHEKSAVDFIEAPAFEVAARLVAHDKVDRSETDRLLIGKTIAHFRVLEKLGAGGMGEVYRARDVRLDRIVAIKVLPRGELANEEAQRRFQREARLISKLSHPHICTIYDVGSEGGLQFIVMEYLEGETLASRLARGPLPFAQILQHGIEIADALEKAHRAGIIHRDLKPGNIMLTKAGAKLLDFGLARIARPEPAATMSAIAGQPTVESAVTGIGSIVGTLQYMAPEQLEGRETDARTDIFAFGSVLYEMATGQRAFQGKSQANVIAAILSSEPTPLLQLSPLSPPALDRLVRTCLAKDPDQRLQNVHDIRVQLEWIRDAGSQAGVAPVTAKRRITRKRVAWSSAAVLLVASAATLGKFYLQPHSKPQSRVMVAIDPPQGYKMGDLEGDNPIALSPDGAQVAYAAHDSKGTISLWVRSLDSLSSRRLEGSESSAGQYSFVWSPDSKGVFANVKGKLVKLSAVGGANVTLCDSFDGAPSSVNDEGTVLSWTAPPTTVFSVSAADCTPRPHSPSENSDTLTGYAYPHFLPDGNHFLFAAIAKNKHHDLLVGVLDSPKSQLLVRDGSFPKYIYDGHVLFSRDGYLMAVKFDARSLRINGEPFLAYPNQLGFFAAFGWAAFDASRNGTISAVEQNIPPSLLRWYSRSGQVLQTLGEPEFRGSTRLSTNQTRVAFTTEDMRTHASEIWTLDLAHGTRKRETFRELVGGVWIAISPTDERLLCSVLVHGRLEMFLKEAGTTGDWKLIQTGLQGSKYIGDFSPDGNSIVYVLEPQNQRELGIYGQSLAGSKPFLVVRATGIVEPPRLSYDGKWVAYESTDSGTSEVYVRSFSPGAATSIQVSSGGGHDPRWSRDGKELFYRTADGHIAAVPVINLKQSRFGKPKILFQIGEGAGYDTIDGQRFLVDEPSGKTPSPLFVITNWKPKPVNSE